MLALVLSTLLLAAALQTAYLAGQYRIATTNSIISPTSVRSSISTWQATFRRRAIPNACVNLTPNPPTLVGTSTGSNRYSTVGHISPYPHSMLGDVRGIPLAKLRLESTTWQSPGSTDRVRCSHGDLVALQGKAIQVELHSENRPPQSKNPPAPVPQSWTRFERSSSRLRW